MEEAESIPVHNKKNAASVGPSKRQQIVSSTGMVV